MAQVITKLLANAINHNRDGGRITVTTRQEINGVVLSVADTGLGISAADLPRVFERFNCADKSRSGGGNGLGLAICQALVTVHGGSIEVSSEEHVATTFTVFLPGRAPGFEIRVHWPCARGQRADPFRTRLGIAAACAGWRLGLVWCGVKQMFINGPLVDH